MTRLYILILILIVTSCEEKVYYPKPRTFPRVQFPEHDYQKTKLSYCEFEFDKPAYGQIIKDTLFFNDKPTNDCWFDILYQPFDAKLHCTYYSISKANTYNDLVRESLKITSQHHIKAEFREEQKIQKDDTEGVLFEFDGDVASRLQFYISDTQSHFLRASLYFNTQARQDSLAPIYDFIKEDVIRMIDTFEWD